MNCLSLLVSTTSCCWLRAVAFLQANSAIHHNFLTHQMSKLFSTPGSKQPSDQASLGAPLGVDSASHSHPTSSLEVIGAGYGRTGTLSLKVALEELGYPCYHMTEVFRNKGHAQLWLQAAKGGDVDIRQLLAGYKATTDFPASSFYKQLMELYPEAKVILTERDPEKWYNSFKATVHRGNQAIKRMPWYVAVLMGVSSMRAAGAMIEELGYSMDLRCTMETFSNEDTAKEVQQRFLQHNKEVKKVVPADRLLVYHVSQGWEPLCAFLGKPVPSKPFPHVNDAQRWKKVLGRVEPAAAVLTYLVPAATAALVAWGTQLLYHLLQA